MRRVLGRVIVLAGILLAVAVSAPGLAPRLLSIAFHPGDAAPETRAAPDAAVVEPESPPPDRADSPRDNSNRVALSANNEGHFVANATINGRTVAVMVDTGATTVALTDATAHRLGLYPAKSAYSERLSTANGAVMAARVTLYEVRLGSVSLRNVTAVVMPAGALPVDLLGMSFLSRLSRYEADGGQLVLTQ